MGGALLCDSGGLRSMHVDELACSADELGRAGLPAQLPVLCLRHGWRSSRFDVICNADRSFFLPSDQFATRPARETAAAFVPRDATRLNGAARGRGIAQRLARVHAHVAGFRAVADGSARTAPA